MKPLLLALATTCLWASPVCRGADTPTPPAPKKTPPPVAATKATAPATPKSESAAAPATIPSGSASPTAPTTAQKMASDFGKQREDRLDQRKALLQRLETAKSEEERQRILAELRQQQQARIEQQRELARQIREQMQNKRGETRPAAAPGP